MLSVWSGLYSTQLVDKLLIHGRFVVGTEWRRAANRAANNGRERKDLYTDNWCAPWPGSSFVNAIPLTSLAALEVCVACVLSVVKKLCGVGHFQACMQML